jgi:hypothetical protein
MRISKSKYIAGVQCLKRLYWQVHEPGMAAEPAASDHAIMEQGREVGLPRQMFPGGVGVDGSAGLEQAIRATRELIANREIRAIFEAWANAEQNWKVKRAAHRTLSSAPSDSVCADGLK